MFHNRLWDGAAVSCLLLSAPALAQTGDAGDATIVVTGQRDPLKLEDAALTAAIVEMLTQDDLQLRGMRTARETLAGVVGAVAGDVPGNPAVVSLHGFAVFPCVAKATTLTLPGRNLFDAFYGEYTGYPGNNVSVGAPRSFEVVLATRL